MNKKAKAKLEKLRAEIASRGYSGEEVIKLIEGEGFIEFLLKGSNFDFESLDDCLIIKADLVYLIIDYIDGEYKLTIE